MRSIWVEKYRPKRLEEVVLPPALLQKIKGYIERQDYPHLLFVGKQGTGKTTVAKILIASVSTIALVMNASDERGIETIRKKVKEFVQSTSFGTKFKTVFLDEADALTPDAQFILRNLMETYSDNSRFILTANYESKIIDPIKSRLQIFYFPKVSKNDSIALCKRILEEEGVKYTEDDLEQVYSIADGDLRKMINILQQSVTKHNAIHLTYKDEIKEFIEVLKSKNIEKLKEFAFSKDRDYMLFYRWVFEHSSVPKVLMLTSEYVYRHSIVIDRAINFIDYILRLWGIK